jgi:hypothetical protein
LALKFHLICEKLALHVRAAELQRDLHRKPLQIAEVPIA